MGQKVKNILSALYFDITFLKPLRVLESIATPHDDDVTFSGWRASYTYRQNQNGLRVFERGENLLQNIYPILY